MDKVRIDKWLWAARFFKTRGVAIEALKGGKVYLNGVKPKPSKLVLIGDKLNITQIHRKVEVTVLDITDKRGNFDSAQKLFSLDSETLNQKKPTLDMALIGYREKGTGRPTKRDRRNISKMEF